MNDYEKLYCDSCNKKFNCYGLLGGLAVCGPCYNKRFCCGVFNDELMVLEDMEGCCETCGKTFSITIKNKKLLEYRP